MDDRTARLLEALDPVGVSLLAELLARPSTEAELLTALEDPRQPTVNRRLDLLQRARLVAREPGKRRAPGRLWTVVHPDETEALLTTLYALSDVVDAKDQARREQAKRRLRRIRAERLGIRQVDDGRPVEESSRP